MEQHQTILNKILQENTKESNRLDPRGEQIAALEKELLETKLKLDRLEREQSEGVASCAYCKKTYPYNRYDELLVHEVDCSEQGLCV